MRHELVAAGNTWMQACEMIPDGSCMGWLSTDQGWPGYHRDYHLLSLYTDALAAQRSGEWRELEAVLAFALRQAQWGSQPDGTFVQRRARWIASGRYEYTLHAPGKQGVLAIACDNERGDGVELRNLFSRETAWKMREEQRAAQRKLEADYKQHRAEVGHLGAGGRLWYEPGQEGGVFLTPSGDRGRMVSAPGALTALGLARGSVFDLLPVASCWWELPEELLSGEARLDRRERGQETWGEPGHPVLPRRASLRSLPARARRTRPSEQRRAVWEAA